MLSTFLLTRVCDRVHAREQMRPLAPLVKHHTYSVAFQFLTFKNVNML